MRVFVFQTEIRFYQQDGWSSQLLSLYITKGSMNCFGCDATDHKKYWTLDKGSSLNIKQMVSDRTISEIIRSEDVDQKMGDLEILRARSWIA